jgi:amidase
MLRRVYFIVCRGSVGGRGEFGPQHRISRQPFRSGCDGACVSRMEFQTAVQLCAALREQRISSRELLDHYLRRVDELDSRLGAVVTLDVERARDEADRADAALARGVDDLELALDVMAGPLPDRARAWRLDLPPARRASLREYRVAAWFDEPACPVDAAMREVLESAVGDLRREGAQIDSKARPQIEFEQAVADYLMLLMPQSGAVQSDEEFAGMVAVRDAMPDDVPEVVRRSLIALVGCHRDWLRAHQRREQVRLRWAEFFRDFDILLCPVTLTPAIEHDHGPYPDRTLEVNGRVRSYMEQIYWPGLITMALLPVTVIPVGRTRDELPVGIQIVGPFLEDRSTLDFARRASQVLGGFEPPPGV